MPPSRELHKAVCRVRRAGLERLIKEITPNARLYLSNVPDLRERLYHAAIDNPALQAKIQETINGQKT